MKTQKLFIGVLTFVALLALAVGLSMAQGADPQSEGEAGVQGTEGVAAITSRVIPIQGRLTDANGNPISGTLDITFRLYTASTGGTAVCVDTDPVTVNNGLFNASMNFCDANDINGQQLYLGIQVAGGSEMEPRQPIYPVPYAFSLVPGAIISNTGSSYALRVEGRGSARYNSALRVNNDLNTTGMATYMTNNSQYATAHFANKGTGEVLYLQNNGGPFIKAVNNAESQTMFTVNYTGTVSQQRQADGLVKASVYVGYISFPVAYHYIDRFFNNVNSATPALTVVGTGHYIIDFGFKVNDRYFVATPYSSGARSITCTYVSSHENQIECYRWDATGAATNGGFMLTIY